MAMSEAARVARNAYMRNYRAKNRRKISEYEKEWREKNPEKVKIYKERYFENLAKRQKAEAR